MDQARNSQKGQGGEGDQQSHDRAAIDEAKAPIENCSLTQMQGTNGNKDVSNAASQDHRALDPHFPH